MRERTGPDYEIAQARCDDGQRLALWRWDHHQVRVGGLPGVLLTHAGADGRPLPPETVEVVFAYADRHPVAPSQVQEIIEQLRFVGDVRSR